MSARYLKRWVVILLALPGLAWGFSLEKLIELHNAGDSSATYSYAAKHFAEMAGDPTYDLYYGLAAINAGHASQGVFALERVLAVTPENHAARLELARGYFVLEEFARARAEFEIVKNAEPPADIDAKIDRYLRAIRRQEGRYTTTTTAFAEFGLGTSDNINNAPDDEQAGPVTLDNPALDDNYTALAAGLGINTPVAPGKAIGGGISLDHRAYADESEFDSGTVRLHGEFTAYDEINRYRLQLRAHQFYFDGDAYRNMVTLYGEWRRRVSQTRRYNFFGQLGQISYPDQEIRDASTISAGAGISQNLRGSLSPIVFASGFLGQDAADDSSDRAASLAERTFAGAQGGVQLTINADMRLVTSAGIVLSRYAEDSNLASPPAEREDDLFRLGTRLIWLLGSNLSLRANLRYTDNSSNIEVYDYDGYSADIRIRYDIN